MLFAEKIDMILFSSPLGFSPLNRDGKLVTFTSELWSCNDLYWIWLQTAHCPFTTLDPYTRHYKIRQIIFQYCNFFYPLHREQKPELTAPQIKLNLHLVRSSGQSEAKNDTLLPTMIAIASPKACLLLISISMYSISARKNKRSTKLSTRKAMFRQTELWDRSKASTERNWQTVQRCTCDGWSLPLASWPNLMC